MENTEMKYRIKVEPINGNDEELDAEYRMGIECSGFTIIADKGGKACVALHNVNVMDIAMSIEKSAELIKAAYVAIAMAEGRQAADRIERAKNNPLTGLLDAMRRAELDK
jgi:hypothetical protein